MIDQGRARAADVPQADDERVTGDELAQGGRDAGRIAVGHGRNRGMREFRPGATPPTAPARPIPPAEGPGVIAHEHQPFEGGEESVPKRLEPLLRPVAAVGPQVEQGEGLRRQPGMPPPERIEDESRGLRLVGREGAGREGPSRRRDPLP